MLHDPRAGTFPFRLVPLLAAGLLCACAGYGPGRLAPGTPESAVRARMGPPTAQYAVPAAAVRQDGPGPAAAHRLEYARGPYGRHTFMIDVDAQGRVVAWEQVLTEAVFNALPQGLTREQLLYRIGRPSEVMVIPRRNEWVWSYRYETPFCQWFQASLDRSSGQVTSTGYGIDPLCDVDARDEP